MYVEKYVPTEHFSVLADWLRKREAYVPGENEMPSTGYLIWERGEPLAAAFLRLCEGNYAQIDSLVTNPDVPGDLRNTAIDVLVERLCNVAKSQGIVRLIAFTTDKNTSMRALRHGFVHLPHTVMVADLTSG